MMRTLTLNITLVLFLLSLCGCGGKKDEGTVLATIGQDKITVSDFNERIENLPPRYRDMIRKRKEEYLQELINDTLLYQEAIRQGVHKDPEVMKVIEEARKKIIIARLLKDKVDDSIDITDEEVALFYDENRDMYMTPEIMRVSHILVPSRKEAEEIVTELRNGADFEAIARARSVDPTAQRGGDIGYFPKGQLLPEFEAACELLDKGQTSGAVKTQLGYHVIKLTDRREPELRPIDQVREDIKVRLRTTERQRLFNEMLEGLRDGTVIEINEEVLSREGPVPDAGGSDEDDTN